MARPPNIDLYPNLSGLRYPQLNTDKFRSGGVMDGPDLQTRAAAMKLQAGVAPTPHEMMRLANRAYLEEQNSAPNGAQASVDTAKSVMAERGLVGPRGIDVNSYAGSMWNGTATPIPGYRPQSEMNDATTEGALRSRFGAPPNERGQIDIADGQGTRSVVNPAIMDMPASNGGDEPTTAAAVMNDPLRSSAPAAPAGPPSLDMSSGPAANSVYRGLQGTKFDPKTFVDQQIARFQARQLSDLHLRTGEDALASKQTEDKAIAQAVMADGDRSSAYLQAGGRNPSMANALMREEPFSPSEQTLPSGTRVIKNSPKSVIPDPQQKIETQAKNRAQYPRTVDAGGRTMIEVSPGKFTDEKGSPLAWKDEAAPLSLNEFYASQSIFDRFDGDYAKYRAQHSKDSKAPAAASSLTAVGTGAAATPGAATKPTAAAQIIYKAADVQAEMKKRGLAK